jgi:hypothetical protein
VDTNRTWALFDCYSGTSNVSHRFSVILSIHRNNEPNNISEFTLPTQQQSCHLRYIGKRVMRKSVGACSHSDRSQRREVIHGARDLRFQRLIGAMRVETITSALQLSVRVRIHCCDRNLTQPRLDEGVGKSLDRTRID